jgi:hypothetical protein
MRVHINRKNICDPILRDINLDEYSKDILGRRKFIETIENPDSAPFCSISAPFCSISAPFCSISCEYCKRSYKYERNLTKHLKTCKLKIIADEEESEISALNNQLDACKSEIKTLKSARKPNGSVNNTQTNNTQNNNNNTINININGTRLSYSDTNYDVVSSENIRRAVHSSLKCVPNIIKATYFNKDHPENHNIYINSIKSGIVSVYNGEGWDAHEWNTFAVRLIRDNMLTLHGWMEVNRENHPRLVEKFDNFTDYQENNNKYNKIMQNEVKLVLYNNRKTILSGIKTGNAQANAIQQQSDQEYE